MNPSSAASVCAVPRLAAVSVTVAVAMGAMLLAPPASADNRRLNESVFVNVYTAQQRNGCTTDPKIDPRLIEAARRHTFDVRDHRHVNGDIGSDGSSVQDRAAAAGFPGPVSETIAINPALAISGIEILNQWWYNPASRATMQDCRNNAIGVWSENSLDRTVVVAVYGQLG
jgi:hypothetical protein